VVIIVPKSLIMNFRDTLLRLGVFDESIDDDFDITTATKFHREFEDVLSISEPERKRAKRALDARMAGAFLVIDEAHEFRTALFPALGQGVRSFVTLEAAHRSIRVLALTDTSLVNRPVELSYLMAIVRQERSPLVTHAFEFLQYPYPGNAGKDAELSCCSTPIRAKQARMLNTLMGKEKGTWPTIVVRWFLSSSRLRMTSRPRLPLSDEQQRHVHKVEMSNEEAMRKSRLNGFSSYFHSAKNHFKQEWN